MIPPQGCILSFLLASMAPHLVAMCFLALCFIHLSAAQSSSIRTDMPVPPLQWLNITGLTSGSSPQPLKDSSIGYDEATRTLIIFGGESQAGLPQQNTYLLDMDTLTWSTPLSKVANQEFSPPARSRALGTGDFAANSRRDFLIYGGKGANNQSFSDVWAYDFLNQFWVNVTLLGTPPSARWGTVGGIDPANIPSSGNNVSTIFNIAGGSNSQTSFPSSDLWQLVVTGTLASDVMAIQGLWQNVVLPSSLHGKIEAGGTLISQTQASGTRVVISGGCGSSVNPLDANVSCVDSSTYVLTVSPGSSVSLGQCPAPRFGPALVPNLNTASASFASQSFMLLGTFDQSKWDDGGGLSQGEVAVLDGSAGTWARLLPSGDPALGTPTFPSPREGAGALSFPSALVGNNRQLKADTIVFGGRDVQGNYLNDIWILRSYNGSITHSGEHWAGFGDSKLDTGISASGAGVTIQYLSQCASLKPTSTPTSSSTATPGTTGKAPRPPSQSNSPGVTSLPTFEVSISHKLLSPLSIALVLVATIIVRLTSPATSETLAKLQRHRTYNYVAIPVGLIAYSVGIAGLATSFTSTTRSSIRSQRRDGTFPDTFLQTAHGQAGLALFVGLYGVVPIFALGLWLVRHIFQPSQENQAVDDAHANDSQDTGPLTGEKDVHGVRRATSPAQSAPEVHSNKSSVRDRRRRVQSGPGLFPGWKGRDSSEISEPGPATPLKGFEVVNRPRRASGGMALYPPRDFSHRPRTDVVRSLSDISWLERRRSVGAVGELDYALSQLGHPSPRSVSPPATSRPPTATMSTRPFVRTPTPPPKLLVELNSWDIILHTLFHTFLLANCIIVLVTLFSRAPIATFIVFLIWTLAFYICLLLLAWGGRPRASVLVTALARFRKPAHSVPPTSPLDTSPMDERESTYFHMPMPGGSPYVYHQPPWRRAVSPEEDLVTRTSHGGLHTVETDDPDDGDDDDDDDRQRRMEEELERRDVNIVTVPRRKLWIANPT